MGKIKEKTPPITSVTIKYDLFDLPTAQHKAGLAGLILQIQSMRDRSLPEGKYPVFKITPTAATVTFTEESVQGLFDDLYAARIAEVAVKSKWQGQTPKREEETLETDEEGKPHKIKRFIYEVTQPCGHFLRQYFPDQDGAWLKLWRDMLWQIPRGKPTTRIPFEQRAADKPCKEGQDAWQDLVKVEQARRKNGFHTTEVAGSLWLGAQATNAELLPFEGRAEQNLLLHCWPLTVLIFVPQQIDMDGASEFVGYVLAIPEVTDLENFVIDYPQMLGQLGKAVRAYRPAEAVIDLPAQGALAFLEHLARLSGQKAQEKSRYSVGSIEYFHLAKIGNNIKSMAAGRVAPQPNLFERYEAIVGRPEEEPPYKNPLFRRGLMLALLNGVEWHEPMASMLAERPWPFFIRSNESPRNLPWFWQDAAAKFHELNESHQSNVRRYQEMANADPTQAGAPQKAPLELLIHRLVRSYVFGKTQEKTGLEWDKIKLNKTPEGKINVPKEWNETKEKIASGAFLEMRSRREQAFVDHFTATFCSVKQFLPEDDFQVVAHALLNEHENVKTLTLLALSANS